MQTNGIWNPERLDELARKHRRVARRMGLSPNSTGVRLAVAVDIAVDALKSVSEAYEQYIRWANWRHYWAQYVTPAASADDGSVSA